MSSSNFQMETIGQILRNKRQALGLLLRQVSAYVDIDQAILSKIERNERKPTMKKPKELFFANTRKNTI